MNEFNGRGLKYFVVNAKECQKMNNLRIYHLNLLVEEKVLDSGSGDGGCFSGCADHDFQDLAPARRDGSFFVP